MSTQQTVTDLAVRLGLLALTYLGVTDDSLSSAVQAAIVAGVALVFAVMTWQHQKSARRTDALAVQAAQVQAQKAVQIEQINAMTPAAQPVQALPDNLAQLSRILTPTLIATLVGNLQENQAGVVAEGRHERDEVPA